MNRRYSLLNAALIFALSYFSLASAQDSTAAPAVSDTSAASSAPVSKSDSTLKQNTEPTGVGTISITSNPDSAVVVLDSSAKGVTPVTLQNVSAGEHVLLIKKEGYFLKKATVYLPADSALSFQFDLIKPVDCEIKSIPLGASITLDDKIKGSSPLSVKKIKPGKHWLVISADGYETLKDSVLISEASKDSLTFKLVPSVSAKPSKENTIKAEKTIRQKIANRAAIGVFLALTLAIIIVELSDMNN